MLFIFFFFLKFQFIPLPCWIIWILENWALIFLFCFFVYGWMYNLQGLEGRSTQSWYFFLNTDFLKCLFVFKFYSYFVVLGMVVQYIMALLDIYVIFFALIIFKDFNEIFFFLKRFLNKMIVVSKYF